MSESERIMFESGFASGKDVPSHLTGYTPINYLNLVNKTPASRLTPEEVYFINDNYDSNQSPTEEDRIRRTAISPKKCFKDHTNDLNRSNASSDVEYDYDEFLTRK